MASGSGLDWTVSRRHSSEWTGVSEGTSTGNAVFGRSASAPATLVTCTYCQRPIPVVPVVGDSEVQILTWNIAAPNNNPFEYWATHESDEYDNLMRSVQDCFDEPGSHDVEIGQIYTQQMFDELKVELTLHKVANLDLLDEYWSKKLVTRKIISEFLKDASFGEKRLISMPDRITGTVKTDDGSEFFRPSPITGATEDISDLPTWWSLWKGFMFHTAVHVRGKSVPNIFSMLERIPRTKYPALSEEEEALSLSLQTLCLAIFDAVLIHLLTSAVSKTWQHLKWSLHKALYMDKLTSCIHILQHHYFSSDVIFIQEASEMFVKKVSGSLDFVALCPDRVDNKRSQMSVILVNRSRFNGSSARDLTAEVFQHLDTRCVERGDLCVAEIVDNFGQPFLLASFHGDSNGRSTCPVLSALHSLAQQQYPKHIFIFGLDANTATESAESRSALNASDFCSMFVSMGLSSCWKGEEIGDIWTTFSARTCLQPQLQKAVGHQHVLDQRNMHLKDWILFYDEQLEFEMVQRDNTGSNSFLKRVIPSQTFPSDHAIVIATMRRRAK